MHLLFLNPVFQIATAATLVAGGAWTWCGFVGIVLYGAVADLFVPGRSHPETFDRRAANALLYVTAAAHFILACSFLFYLWRLDLSAIGAATVVSLVGAVLSAGTLIGHFGGSAGHEFCHRGSPSSQAIARMMFGSFLYSSFIIAHKYGHHRNAGTFADAATARRGEDLWRFMLRSAFGAFRESRQIEAARLRGLGRPFLSSDNRLLQGHIFDAAFLIASYLAGGIAGVFLYTLMSAVAVSIIEMANYIAHYGLVRVEGEPFEPRHAWNTDRLVSSSAVFILTHHSSHHAQSARPYWRLTIEDDAPVAPFGISTLMAIAMWPPAWFRLMEPCLADWDERLASRREKALIAERFAAGNSGEGSGAQAIPRPRPGRAAASRARPSAPR